MEKIEPILSVCKTLAPTNHEHPREEENSFAKRKKGDPKIFAKILEEKLYVLKK